MPLSRNQLVGLVHKGCKNLDMDEETRRQWQQGMTGHASCATMSFADLDNLVAELRKRGGLTDAKKPSDDPMVRKIFALWMDLGKIKAISDTTPKALGKWLHRGWGKYRPEWLTLEEKQAAINGLRAWAQQVRAKKARGPF